MQQDDLCTAKCCCRPIHDCCSGAGLLCLASHCVVDITVFNLCILHLARRVIGSHSTLYREAPHKLPDSAWPPVRAVHMSAAGQAAHYATLRPYPRAPRSARRPFEQVLLLLGEPRLGAAWHLCNFFALSLLQSVTSLTAPCSVGQPAEHKHG